MAHAAPVPVYGTIDLYIGTGIVGGVVRGTRETGTRVGQMSLQILVRTPSAGHSDRRRAARPDFRLAPDEALGHRSVAAPTRFGHPIQYADHVGILSPYIIATHPRTSPRSCCSSSGSSRSEPDGVALKKRSGPGGTIRTSYERIRQLAGRLINAQEARARDIARDLHDDVCQELVGVSIAVGSLKRSSG